MNKKNIIILYGLVALLCVLESSNINYNLNFCDVILIKVYGVNKESTIMNIFNWITLYMLIIANISIYIENTMINEKSYIWILRYKSYTKWILYTIKNILIIIIRDLTIFYMFLCLFSFIFTQNFDGTSEYFKQLNDCQVYDSIGIMYVVIQCLLSMVCISNLALLQILITLFFNNFKYGMVCHILIVIISATIAKAGGFNPVMLSRYNIIDSTSVNYPTVTIIVGIIINIFIAGIIVVFMKKRIRR